MRGDGSQRARWLGGLAGGAAALALLMLLLPRPVTGQTPSPGRTPPPSTPAPPPTAPPFTPTEPAPGPLLPEQPLGRRVTLPAGGRVIYVVPPPLTQPDSPRPPGPTPIEVRNYAAIPAEVVVELGQTLISVPEGYSIAVTTRGPVEQLCPLVSGLPHMVACPWSVGRSPVLVTFTAVGPPPPVLEAVLDLSDPRPCIPAPNGPLPAPEGSRACPPGRAALWEGEAEAWAAQGVPDPDSRFKETVVYRVRAGDPAAIGAIARLIGSPYVKVLRIRFTGPDDFSEVVNLGGAAQELTGWTLRSPDRGLVFRFPAGYVLEPGRPLLICGRCLPPCPTGPVGGPLPLCQRPTPFQLGFGASDVWPDAGGRVVLYYDALDLLADETRYSADPADQPPPPALQVIRR